MAVGVQNADVSLGEWLRDPSTWQFQPHHASDVAQRVAAFLVGFVYLGLVGSLALAKESLDPPRGLRALHITFLILHSLFALIFAWVLVSHCGEAGEWAYFPVLANIIGNFVLLALHALPLLKLERQTRSSANAGVGVGVDAAATATTPSGSHRPLLDFTIQ